MTCAACSARVQQVSSAVDGVASANVNLLKNSMEVELAEGVEAAQVAEAISEAVNKAGYGAQLRAGASADGASELGADFVAAAHTQSARREEEARKMRNRLIISLVFGVPLFYLCMGHMFGWPTPFNLHEHAHMQAFVVAQLVLLIPIVVVNRSYFTRGFKSLIHGAPNMDALVALGATASILYSAWGVFSMQAALHAGNMEAAHQAVMNLYFDSAGMILALITVGKYFEARAKGKTTGAIEALVDLSPQTAIVERNGEEVEVPTAEVRVGDVCIVRAGAAVPCDGFVLDGVASVDESALTGESIPVEKQAGDALTGATVNTSGWLRMEASRVGNDTALAQIIRLVDDATSTKAPIERVADKIAGIFVPVVIGIALLTFIAWLALGGGFEAAINHAITVLVISCPCALGLATPTAIMVGMGAGARKGILIKSAEALETAHATQHVVFDKTGTITQGSPEVSAVLPAPGIDNEQLLLVALAVEARSEHPLARAIVDYGRAHAPEQAEAAASILPESFTQIPGGGLDIEIEGMHYLAGNAVLMRERGVDIQALQADADKCAAAGATPLFFAEENTALGLIALADTPKESSANAIAQLKAMGIESTMLTGDNEQTASAIAAQVGVDHVIANVLPQDKEEQLRRLCEVGATAMVGDGINDAPALARADVGIVVGGGTDVAIEAADMVLVSDDLQGVPAAIDLSRATMRNIKQNLFWALFYNVICIPVAAGVLTPFGITLNPMIAAAAMSLSSLFVVSNALRLRFWK